MRRRTPPSSARKRTKPAPSRWRTGTTCSKPPARPSPSSAPSSAPAFWACPPWPAWGGARRRSCYAPHSPPSVSSFGEGELE